MDNDITQTTQTNMSSVVTDYEPDSKSIDEVSDQKEIRYTNTKFGEQLTAFKTYPQLNRSITALAVYTAGKGYTCESSRDEIILDHITGWGEDTFLSIIINMLKVKKFGEDAYAEIIRDEKGTLINLKPLNTGKMTIVCGRDGVILRYEYSNGKNKPTIFKPQEILHFCNERIANEMHGTSILEVCEWALKAKQQAMEDLKRITHISTVRIIYADVNDKTRLANVKSNYAEGIKNHEVVIFTCRPEDMKFEDLNLPPIEAFLSYFRYLDSFIYQAVGVPKDIVTTEGSTESASKMGTYNFEPTYSNERIQLEMDIWNQLAIKLKFGEQPTLDNALQTDTRKDAGQMGIQPNDTIAGVGE